MMTNNEKDFLSAEFSLLLSNTLTSSGSEQLFGIGFVITVETGFIPSSLAEHFNSVNSNIELAKKINNQPLNSFWHQDNNIFYAQLVMSNHLCNLTGIPVGDSLIITLSYSNTSKCTILDSTASNFDKKRFFKLFLKFKNSVSIPIKCAVLDTAIGVYPNLCGIPEELILCIMSKLTPNSLYALMQTCKKMNNIATTNEFLWKRLVYRELKKLLLRKPISKIPMDQQMSDWRIYFYQLKKENSSKGKTTIIRREH